MRKLLAIIGSLGLLVALSPSLAFAAPTPPACVDFWTWKALPGGTIIAQVYHCDGTYELFYFYLPQATSPTETGQGSH